MVGGADFQCLLRHLVADIVGSAGNSSGTPLFSIGSAMRKRVLSAVSALLLMVFLSLCVTGIWDYLDSKRLDSIGMGAFGLTIQVRGCTKDPVEVFSAVAATAEGSDVSIFRVYDGFDDEGNITRNLVGSFCWDTFPVDQLDLMGGRLPSGPGEYLSSRDVGDDCMVGLLFDFAGDDPIVIRPADIRHDSDSSVNGLYRIVSTRRFDERAVLQGLSRVFGESPEDLLRVGTVSVRGIGLLTVIAGAMAVLALIIYIMTVSSSAISLASAIGVQKMLGWSTAAVVWDVVGAGLWFQLCGAAVVDVALFLVIRPLGASFPWVLVGVQGALVAITQVVGALTTAFVCRGIPTAAAIKGGVSLKGPMAVGFGVKVAFAVLLAVAFSVLSPSLDEVLRQWRLETVWRQRGEGLYVIADTRFTNRQAESLSSGDGEYRQRFGDLYPMLDDEYGALFVKAVDLEGVVSTGSDALPQMTVMDVNPNYLEREGVLSVTGGRMDVPEETADRVVALPSTMGEGERNEVARYLEGYFESLYESQGLRWDGALELVTYEGGRDFFSYNRSVQAGNGNMVTDPIFNILTKKNITPMERSDLSVTGVNAPVLLPVDREQADRLERWFDENGFEEDDVRIDTLAKVYGDQLVVMGGAMASVFGFLVAVLVLDGFADVLTARLLVLGRGRRYGVECLLGWGWFGRHGVEAMGLGAVVLVAGVISLLMGVGSAAFFGLLTTLLLDYAVFFLTLGLLEWSGVDAVARGV